VLERAQRRFHFMLQPRRAAQTMNQKNPYKKADKFTEAAKKAGYPARSVFKLEEIDRRTRILRKGQHVVDLGAAPGSWSKYVAEKIGERGKLLAIDRQELRTALPAWARFVMADCFALDGAHYTEFGPFDVVLSDMAPNTTGNRFTDQTRSTELFLHALEVAKVHGAPGSSFVGKIFMGEDFPAARAEVRKLYEQERLIRPEGTRQVSYEIFVIGLRKREVEPVAAG
jgi:23S rRNA (uridine2552-2'-O)-methyltransferase